MWLRRMRFGGLVCAATWMLSCSAGPVPQANGGTPVKTGGSGGSASDEESSSSGGAGGGVSINLGRGGSTGAISLDAGRGDDCADSAKLVYLVTEQNYLYSFDPRIDGLAAYKRIGTLACETESTPQSMSVDRLGKAYVFYSSGHLYYVSTTTAECTPTGYVHPVEPKRSFNQLGMGFTAATPGASDQVLYIHSPEFGLATVDLQTLAVNKLNLLSSMVMELTGGPDAVLFGFASNTSELYQIDRTSHQTQSLHKFKMTGVSAFAFARYSGVFYVFTSGSSGGMTTTTMFDPQTNTEAVRDASIGVTVVGAGQSICVPPPKIM